jgi:hypothetical protein
MMEPSGVPGGAPMPQTAQHDANRLAVQPSSCDADAVCRTDFVEPLQSVADEGVAIDAGRDAGDHEQYKSSH